jgi:hypothetical protein
MEHVPSIFWEEELERHGRRQKLFDLCQQLTTDDHRRQELKTKLTGTIRNPSFVVCPFPYRSNSDESTKIISYLYDENLPIG